MSDRYLNNDEIMEIVNEMYDDSGSEGEIEYFGDDSDEDPDFVPSSSV